MSSPSSPAAYEPPRKRQRTVERELAETLRSSTSSNAHGVPDEVSAAEPSSSAASSLPLPPVSIGNVGTSDGGLQEADTATDTGSETRQTCARPEAGGSDAQGGTRDALEGMNRNASDKGKAKATMSSLSQGTHHNAPTDRPAEQSAHCAGCDRDHGGGADRARHAASGAGHTKAGSVMDIDHPGLARLAQDEDAPGRDAEYYIEGADCVIRVEDTLFRVHRYLLGRDSSAFQHMFSMPALQGGAPSQCAEGYSDDNPIRLYGESVERFRDLLSVLYDLPPQLQAYNTPEGNVDRLLTICEMTNKYHFASIEAWATDALYNVISGLHGRPQQPYDLAHCSSAWMRRLLEVAMLCGHDKLLQLVADRWVDRILKRDLRPIHALDIAARCGHNKLLGYAYYVQLLEMGPDFDPGVVEDGRQFARGWQYTFIDLETFVMGTVAAANGEPRIGTPAVLTREQKQRLLSGHWSLTRLWERLRGAPPRFDRPEGCTYHQHGCLSTWAQVWREVGRSGTTLRLEAADVLGRLKVMQEQLSTHADLSNALSPQCKRAALLALKAAVTEVEEGLAGHFRDLTASPASVQEERA
ncbi:hypothetical protein OH77DRAFT_1428282 [Trametes cingulata]|nr:hypothetical protein OH77DRAFT_1428282 [Trametes cingulata]